MNWETVQLGSLCRFQGGSAFPRDEQGKVSGEFPFIKVSDMTLPRNAKHIVVANNWVDQSTVTKLRLKPSPAGSIVFAKIGEGLKAERLRILTRPTILDNNMMAAVPSSNADASFLFFLLEHLHIADYAEGSALPYLRASDLSNLPVALPVIDEQRGIAATLGALDDKIESNRRAVELIKRLLVLEFQKLLSTESVDYQPLSELTSITKGISYKSADLQPSRTSLVTLKSFDRNGGYKADGLKQYVGPYKAQQMIDPGEVVVAQTDLTQGAEVVGRAVRVPADSSADVLVASLDLVIVRPNVEITPEYLLGVLVDESFREHCRSRTSGTTVLHLAGDAIPSYLAPIVCVSAQQSFSDLSHPLIARTDSLNIETVRLMSLRDTLLPELLSGRIRVPEAHETVQEVIA